MANPYRNLIYSVYILLHSSAESNNIKPKNHQSVLSATLCAPLQRTDSMDVNPEYPIRAEDFRRALSDVLHEITSCAQIERETLPDLCDSFESLQKAQKRLVICAVAAKLQATYGTVKQHYLHAFRCAAFIALLGPDDRALINGFVDVYRGRSLRTITNGVLCYFMDGRVPAASVVLYVHRVFRKQQSAPENQPRIARCVANARAQHSRTGQPRTSFGKSA